MLSISAQSAANTANRVRLKEILAKIDDISKTGRYSSVFYITPNNTDQTIFVQKELDSLEFTTISSPFKHKLFVSWEPDRMKNSPLWYIKRATQLFQLII